MGFLITAYIFAVILGGIINSFLFSAGKMLVPVLIGAGLLRWASSARSVRNIYIGIALVLILFIFQDYSESRSQVVRDLAYGCANNNSSVDATTTFEQQKLEYCGCMAEELVNLIMMRWLQEHFSSGDEAVTPDDFAKNIGMKSKITSAQQLCSVRASG